MIDMTGNKTYSKDELKARAMARLAEKGLGLAERLANIERIVYSLLDVKGTPLTDKAQVTAIGSMLTVAESDYNKELVDNGKLELVIEHEKAVTRLAIAALDPVDYPSTKDDKGVSIPNAQLETDTAERMAAQTIIEASTAATLKLVKARVPVVL